MKIIAADWLPYCLPLKHHWKTSQSYFSERHGRLLRLQTEADRVGWGDCAPLPEFGISEMAARDFAEETAYLDLVAQNNELTLNSWLSGEPSVRRVAVNANLGAIFSVTDQAVGAALESGCTVLKIKVGMGDWQDELARLLHLGTRLPPNARLRLDANAAWTTCEAELFLTACTPLPVEGLEEPLRQPSLSKLARLQNRVPFPLAIDESNHLIGAEFFHQPPVRRLILKPARYGGLLRTLEIALRARAAGLECIVTSSLESTCGLLACAHLAAAVAPQAVHGLGTGEWFLADTGQTPKIVAGHLPLPTTPGLGFSPFPEFA